MDTTRSSSRVSSRANESFRGFSLYPATVSRSSKAQELLGLSRAELQSAKHESLNSMPEPQTDTSSTTAKASTGGLFRRSRKKSPFVAIQEIVQHSPDKGGVSLPSLDSDLASRSQDARLKKLPSTSTLRSFYDAAKAPLRVSQQTSDSSSQEYLQRAAQSQPPSYYSNTMDTAGYKRFFSSSKQNIRIRTDDVGSESHRKETRAEVTSTLQNSVDSPPTCDLTSKSQMQNFFRHGPKRIQSSMEQVTPSVSKEGSTQGIFNTPYAKLHVRRPKFGNQNWFDDIDGVSSDEEEHEVPGETTWLGAKDEHLSELHDDSSVHSFNTRITRSPTPQSAQAAITTIVELPVEAAVSSVPEDEDHVRSVCADLSKSPTLRSKSRSSIYPDLAPEDVSQPTNLRSELDTGETDDRLRNLQPVSSVADPSPIRESIDIDNYEDKDLKIGIARVVVAYEQSSVGQPSPVEICKPSVIDDAPLPDSYLLSNRAFNLCEDDADFVLGTGVDVKDADEDELLSSFPATPTDVVIPRKTSSRSSITQSDDRSVKSMRLMKVTRQEENLIAAMRMKRASMQRAAEETAIRKNTTSTQQLPSEKIFVATNRPRNVEAGSFAQGGLESRSLRQDKLTDLGLYQEDNKLDTSQLVKAYLNALPDKMSTDIILPPRTSSRRRVHHRNTNSLNEMMKAMSNSDARPAVGSISRPSTVMSTRSQVHRTSDSNIIVLENLHSGIPSQVLPSQLYMESPFVSWEKIDSARVH